MERRDEGKEIAEDSAFLVTSNEMSLQQAGVNTPAKNWSEDDKLKILLAELQERYNASHKIRERSMQFTLWISGMAVGLCWMLISQKALTLSQQTALTLLIAALFPGTIHFIMGLQRGFKNNRESMVQVERALGMHESGIFFPTAPLLPAEYGDTKRRWSDHFCTLRVWLALVGLSLLLLTWVHPNSSEKSQHNTQTTIKISEEQKNG